MSRKSRTPRLPVAPSASPVVDPNTAPALPARGIYGARGAGSISLAPTLLDTSIRSIGTALAARMPETTRRPGARARYYDVTLPNITAADAPALLALASRIIGAVVPNTDPNPLPADAFDSIISHYYANRGLHPAAQHDSDADRFDCAASLAMMLLSNADRVRNITTRRVLVGSYGRRNLADHVAPSVASYVAAALNPAPATP